MGGLCRSTSKARLFSRASSTASWMLRFAGIGARDLACSVPPAVVAGAPAVGVVSVWVVPGGGAALVMRGRAARGAAQQARTQQAPDANIADNVERTIKGLSSGCAE